MKRTKVFISYSHRDVAALERLQVHLKPLERQGIVNRWDDTKIKAGQEWKAEIETALSEARVAILLVSADFLASSFIDRDELPPILLAQKEEGLVVLPVILKPCRFTRTPTLKRFQSVNSPSSPLLGLSDIEQERVWVQLCDRVEDILQKAGEANSTNVGMAIDEGKKSVSSVSADVANSMSAKPIELSELKLAAMKAEIEGDIGKSTELWHQILAQVPSDSEAAAQLTRLEQLSGTEKVADSRATARQDFSEDLGDGVSLTMVAIPGGDFLMGSPLEEEDRWEREGPQHRVSLTAFWMGMYPVTQEQWKQVAGYPKVNVDLSASPSKFPGDDRPVERISWHEAVEFCDRLSQKTGKLYRLPSEAEWEYVCRAGTVTPFSFGETISTDLANYNGNYVYGQGKKGEYREQTTSVGSFEANAFGLCDMHGNVWEWCADWWHKNYDDAPPGGTPWIKGGDERYRVVRGGSWLYAPWNCRSADRYRNEPDNRLNVSGFRVVCSSA